MVKSGSSVGALSHVAAVALLVLVAMAAAALLYLWEAGTVGRTVSDKSIAACAIKIDAAATSTSYVDVWLRSLRCKVNVTLGYLEGVSNSRAYKLNAVPPAELAPGEVEHTRFFPSEMVSPGFYRLKIPVPLDDAATVIRVDKPVAGGPYLEGSLEKLNGTEVGGEAYTVRILVIQESAIDYNLTFYICAKPGYRIYYEYAEIRNATWQPPIHLGIWYKIEASEVYTYPDCVIRYWSPLHTWEEPYHIVFAVKWTKS